MKCNKCKSTEFNFKQNSVHIECRCKHCDSHIKFIPKVEFDKMDIELEKVRTNKPLF